MILHSSEEGSVRPLAAIGRLLFRMLRFKAWNEGKTFNASIMESWKSHRKDVWCSILSLEKLCAFPANFCSPNT